MVRCARCRRTFRAGYRYCPHDGDELVADGVDPLLGATVAGRYVIEAQLGAGAFGRVYQARHHRLSRRFALKVLNEEAARDPKHRRRLLREAETAALVHHPHLVGVLDVGETEQGLTYLVMDLAPGETLAAILERDGPMPAARAAAILRQLADALSHAHDHGLVHRDLKPGNVLVEIAGEQPCARLVDFGLAIADPYAAGERLTTVGMVVGTPAYLSPEQAAGNPVDHRCDLYALGVVLYEMLSGAPPFEGRSVDVVAAHINATPARIAADPLLEALAFWLMEKRPEARPQHAHHVLEVLDTIVADPAAARERLQTWLDPERAQWKPFEAAATVRW